jgi:5'-deoxynucleotidase YfbR-like HD superfamily hydrolase
MICNHYRIYDAHLLAAVQSYAIVHDMVEMRSGDFVRTFKYKNPDLKKAVDETEDMVIEEFEGPTKALYTTASMLMNLSDRPAVKKIVKAADFLSLFNYMTREVLRGNSEIAPFYKRMVDDLQSAATSEKPMVINGQTINLAELYDYLYRRGKNVHMRISPHMIELSNRTV